IAKNPQAPSLIGSANHLQVNAIQSDLRAVLLGIIEGYPLLEMGSRSNKLSQPEQGIAQHVMRHGEERRISQALGGTQQLLPYLKRRLILRPHIVKPPQPPQHREELLRVPHLLAEISCPRIDAFHFWGLK